MSCYKKRKAECTGPDCQWTVGKGCKPLSEQLLVKPAPKANTKSISKNLQLLSKESFKKLIIEDNFEEFTEDLFIQFNKMLIKVCKHAFKKQVTEGYTINDIDANFSKIYYNKIVKLFKEACEKTLVSGIREKVTNSIYTSNFASTIEKHFKVTLKNKRLTALYLAGGLEYMVKEILSTTGENGFEQTLDVSHVEEALQADEEIEEFFELIDFEFKTTSKTSNSNSNAKQKNSKVNAKVDANRLPKQWIYYSTKETHKKALARFKSQMIPGDLMVDYDGYRGSSAHIMERDGSVENVMQNGRGHGFIPGWVGEMYMKKGYNLKDIIAVYEDSPCMFFIYPKSKQGKALEITSNGQVMNLKGFDYDSGEDADADWMEWDPAHESYVF